MTRQLSAFLPLLSRQLRLWLGFFCLQNIVCVFLRGVSCGCRLLQIRVESVSFGTDRYANASGFWERVTLAYSQTRASNPAVFSAMCAPYISAPMGSVGGVCSAQRQKLAPRLTPLYLAYLAWLA